MGSEIGAAVRSSCSISKGRRLPPAVETTLYRVLQEAITNIVKHAGARKVGVILRATRDDVVMIIEDDGKGFDPETVNRGSSRRFGLLGMRERLALIHGSLEIETEPGAGTTLIVRAPLMTPPPRDPELRIFVADDHPVVLAGVRAAHRCGRGHDRCRRGRRGAWRPEARDRVAARRDGP